VRIAARRALPKTLGTPPLSDQVPTRAPGANTHRTVSTTGCSPTVEIGRKVMGGVRPHSAHVKNRISDFRGEAIDMLWIPGLVMR
jgi:hypothetical protein